jgi:hypothetical protein
MIKGQEESMVFAKVTFEVEPGVGGRQAAESSARSRIEAVRCPVHNQNAEIEFTGKLGTRRNYEIRTCCNGLRQKALRMLDA